MSRIRRYKSLQTALENQDDVKHLVLKTNIFQYEICALHNLEILRLISPNYPLEIPEEIIHLSKLRSLAFRNTEVGTFPSFIGDLKNLEKIDFGKNVVKIDAKIWELEKLNAVRIDCSHLEKFPEDIINCASLEHIEIKGFNENPSIHLKDILLVLAKLPNLKSLNLSSQEIKTLPKEIGDLQHLVYLDITFTGLQSVPEDLSKLHNLQTIRLMENSRELKAQIKKYLPNKGKLVSKWTVDVRGLKATQHAVRDTQMYITGEAPVIYNNV
ncbi:leucine-rich repeat domain-containing protein [Kordia sp.]|uniref:leucine-rich repeat domain-containing protein n=1 Tax=Kordia sp. TaxID=1965332 RepID=UPI003D6A8710